MQQSANVALARACRFLAKGQGPDGFWRDYLLPPGAGTEWVTGFVGYALSRARAHGAVVESGSLDRALSALRSSCRPSGWGYNARVATDADTTSWVVRSFARERAVLPIEPVSCLEAYVGPAGGARTFVCGPRYGRWTIEHVDVTAVLGLAMTEIGLSAAALERVRCWTLDQRTGNGLWASFWWTFDAYATARVLELLAHTGGIPHDVVEAAQDYLGKETEGASAMETANLLMIAARVGSCPDRWMASLLGQQRSDGGWPPSRVLKVPDQEGRAETEPTFEDTNGFMSTAMAAMALTEFLDTDRGHV